MAENNELLSKLLEDKQKTTTSSAKASPQGLGSQSHSQKIINLRYKIYVVVACLLLRVVWSRFLSPALQESQSVEESLETGERRLEGMTQKLNTYRQDQQYVERIQDQEDAIRACINFSTGCDDLDDDIAANNDVVKAFFQIGNLYDPKMVIDEKSLLMNLDAFMTKRRDAAGKPTPQNNGSIEQLIIGDPQQISEQLYQVSVDVVITFPDSDDLMSFITNTEDRIIVDVNTELFKSTPVLYRIQELAYDIVNYEEEQEVQINMIAYYYEQKDLPPTTEKEESE